MASGLAAIALIGFLFDQGIAQAANPTRPFPQHVVYTAGSIKPAVATQVELDAAVATFYSTWKSRYLKPALTGQFYVYYNADGNADTPNGRSISEGHGYGMLATVLMAGADADAQTEFNGLYRYFRAHPSVNNPDLMAWNQVEGFVEAEGGDSATDGDLDIAFALLLAAAQWGNDGSIDYHAEALKVIAAIMKNDVNQRRWTLKLGDWTDAGDHYFNGTRSSDFMLQHLKAFKAASGDSRWEQVVDKTYSILGGVYRRHAKSTGLMPDFIILGRNIYEPAEPKYLESKHDGQFSYNACRTPWRVATDYLINGDPRALPQLQKLNAWIQRKTDGDPSRINAGYALNGRKLAEDNNACFTAPLAVNAMIGAENQAWLDALWSHLLSRDPDDDGYYGNSVRLLCMIVISGNWWVP